MPTKVNLETKSFFQKLFIYWNTKDYGHKLENIALILSVAIYMNNDIFQEELETAHEHIFALLNDANDAENIMEYIKLQVQGYQTDQQKWVQDRQKAHKLIVNDQDLYLYMIDVFKSDENFSDREETFEDFIKRSL